MSLAEGIQIELERCILLREEYIKIGPVGTFAKTMLDHYISDAQKAIAENNVVQIMVCYERLKGCE